MEQQQNKENKEKEQVVSMPWFPCTICNCCAECQKRYSSLVVRQVVDSEEKKKDTACITTNTRLRCSHCTHPSTADEAIDVWGLGTLLYMMLFLQAPFDERMNYDFSQLVHEQHQKRFWFESQLVSKRVVSCTVIDLLQQLLQPQPHLRPCLDMVLAHPFFHIITTNVSTETQYKADMFRRWKQMKNSCMKLAQQRIGDAM
jgi:serine/threonine protein kinase